MDNEQIRTTIEHFKENGENVRVRDIAYTLLSKMFADPRTAYQCLFNGDTDGYDEYSNDDMRMAIEEYMTEQGFIRSVKTDDESGTISFEENRKEMEGLLNKTQKALEDGLIDPKDAFKIMADIRVKLADKFKIEHHRQERMIVVEKKYNAVCSYCHHEIYIPTIEDLKKEYNLIEKQ